MKKVLISPSVLNADFTRLNEECISLQESGADWIHCDVMDGVFVPNTALSADIVSRVKTAVTLPLDVHLMVQMPHEVAEDYVSAGADTVTFHIESHSDVVKTSSLIRAAGAKVGISLRPATPVEILLPYAELFDMILIMTVEPGFGGQTFLPNSIGKIKTARKLFPDKLIEVDGGINADTGALAIHAGADVLVAGSYIIKSADRKSAILNLKSL